MFWNKSFKCNGFHGGFLLLCYHSLSFIFYNKMVGGPETWCRFGGEDLSFDNPKIIVETHEELIQLLFLLMLNESLTNVTSAPVTCASWHRKNRLNFIPHRTKFCVVG